MAQELTCIAIVDDDPSVLKSLSRTLRVRGYQTYAYESASDFLASLTGKTPACLIVDVQMPGMTGIELIQHLMTAGIHIPTIVITANTSRILERPESKAITAVLTKPLLNTELFGAINLAIGEK
ncbi:response regulator transcription factor [Bosea lathyri]|uniref:Response regulator receiver domain-containing protein n=1 Tax=Bosea lathyri TaxID=1036778 RepID=A0A1H6CT01_9HYPH|nr:response regulator [Bosea lathyri]SEG75566.1 Response regulator receiver domain-containing protein [Bosea lathyri]